MKGGGGTEGNICNDMGIVVTAFLEEQNDKAFILSHTQFAGWETMLEIVSPPPPHHCKSDRIQALAENTWWGRGDRKGPNIRLYPCQKQQDPEFSATA